MDQKDARSVMSTNEQSVEAVARAMCAFEGLDPDEDCFTGLTKPKTRKRWEMREFAGRARAALAALPAVQGEGEAATSFQDKVQPWLTACFGEMIARDREERNHRFLEEALELVQACGCTASEAHQLVDYVYERPVGALHQEVGGVMVTLAALCLANDADMHAAGRAELERIWGKVDAIRAKQAAKPKHSPLPEYVHLRPADQSALVVELVEALMGVLRMTDFDQQEPWIVKANEAITRAKQIGEQG